MGGLCSHMGNCFNKTFDIPISSPSYHSPTWSPPPSPPPSQPSGAPMGRVLQKPLTDMSTLYKLDEELGRGQFGTTYLCRERSTGKRFACKSISMSGRVVVAAEEDVRREVLILQHLTGQPNVVELHGAYEDAGGVHLVVELCSGGELFDRIVRRGSYSEKEAARICREIVNVVHVCHFMGVIHRDLKPENFLLVTADEDAEIKLIDFGLSVFIEEGKTYKDVVGSAYYIAPEVLRRCYGKEIDVWSVGVILYILLCGVPPFFGETEKEIFDEILEGEVDLEAAPWPSISESAKDLIRKMLTYDPKQRITAAQALEHPWIREGGLASDKPMDSAVLTRMKQFRAMNKLKKLALMVIAQSQSEEEIKGLKQMFKNMDTDGSGTITYEELKAGLSILGSKLTESEVKQLMDAADVDRDGSIDYMEFITATMHRHKLEKEENLFRAFQYFDTDGSGFITREELKHAMAVHGMGDEETINEVLEDVDTDKDGKIDYHEFVTMMRKGTK